jgi:hypothetical protein
MVKIKTNKHSKTTKNKKKIKRCKSLSNNRNTKRRVGGEKTKSLIKLDVYITPENDLDKRKIELNVKTFYDFYDYLKEVDTFLNKKLNEELLAFTDPKRYDKWKLDNKPILKSYAVDIEKPATI